MPKQTKWKRPKASTSIWKKVTYSLFDSAVCRECVLYAYHPLCLSFSANHCELNAVPFIVWQGAGVILHISFPQFHIFNWYSVVWWNSFYSLALPIAKTRKFLLFSRRWSRLFSYSTIFDSQSCSCMCCWLLCVCACFARTFSVREK